MVVIAWYSTYVVEPVVQSVILVERSPVTETTERAEEINSSTVEEVRQAVTQFLQQQQHSSDSSPEQQEQQQTLSNHQEEVDGTHNSNEIFTFYGQFLNFHIDSLIAGQQ